MYPAILLNLLLCPRNWFVCSFWFSPYMVLLSANKDGFPFSFQSVFLIPFLLLAGTFPYSVGWGQGEIHLVFHHWHRVGCGFYRGSSRWRRDPPASAPVLSVKECGTSQILPLYLWGASHGILLLYVTVVRCSDFC